MRMRRYLSLTRSHSYSLLFALPLLAFYEAGAIYIAQAEGSNLRNGADVMLRAVLSIGGLRETAALTLVVIAVSTVLVFLERRRRAVPLRLPNFLGMAAESLLYAAILGIVVGTATQWLLNGIPIAFAAGSFTEMSQSEALVLSLGAGLYEEIVFRVIVVGGLFGVFRTSGLESTRAGAFSVILAALIFSGFHYIGAYGDVWAIPSFLFRFLAGIAFSVLFLLRGFGITAWTHALYDVLLVLGSA
ncbi:MAG: CPBP family intramembrane metalloprotease [Gemmatimonas sp.]|nr:CPBP family intramembrane metalloprotease [Gemmatimonas sp.]